MKEDIDDTSLIEVISFNSEGLYIRYSDAEYVLSFTKKKSTDVQHRALMHMLNSCTIETRYAFKSRLGIVNFSMLAIEQLIHDIIDESYDSIYEYINSFPIPKRVTEAGSIANRKFIGEAINRHVEKTILPEEYIDFQIGALHIVMMLIVSKSSSPEEAGSLIYSWVTKSPVELFFIDDVPVSYTEYFAHLIENKLEGWEYWKKLSGLRRFRLYYYIIENGAQSSLKHRLELKTSSGMTLEVLFNKLANSFISTNIDIENTINGEGDTTELLAPICYTASKAGTDKLDSRNFHGLSAVDEVADNSPAVTMGLGLSTIMALHTKDTGYEIDDAYFYEHHSEYIDLYKNMNEKIIQSIPNAVNLGWDTTPYSFYKYAIVLLTRYDAMPTLSNKLIYKDFILLGTRVQLIHALKQQIHNEIKGK